MREMRQGLSLCLAGVLLLGGCGRKSEPEAAPPADGATSLASAVDFSAVAGAESYDVQAWSGDRLLWRRVVARPPLVLDSSSLRAMQAADSVVVLVHARDAQSRSVGTVQRRSLED